jgi:hypothetical protein
MAEGSSWLSDWADVLASAVGGGVIAMLVWVGMSQPCPVEGTPLTLDCVRVFGLEWSMAEVAFFVPIITMAIGFAIHAARD